MNLDKFIKNYRPRMSKANPDQLRRFSGIEEELTKLPIEHVWSCVDSDGRQAIVPGFHRVNNLYYVLTNLPWTNENSKVTL